MPCYRPITGYRSKYVNKSGKRSIVFNTTDGLGEFPLQIPCGQCRGCRLEYSRQWAIRIHHENQLHEKSAFITLTFDNDHLPENHSISKKDLQNFFKNLRKIIYPKKIRYFACGEYGDKKGRPHYHAIIFGYDFPDKKLHTVSNGHPLYTSDLLLRAWNKKGHVLIGEVTFESAAYCARYIMKKQKGTRTEKNKEKYDEYEEKYKLVDTETGELHLQEKEFCLMSRRPGIGAEWVEKFKTDTDKDYITIRGKKMSLPKYYDKILEEMHGEDMDKRKLERFKKRNKEDMTYERLAVREKVKEAQLKQLPRNYEDS